MRLLVWHFKRVQKTSYSFTLETVEFFLVFRFLEAISLNTNTELPPRRASREEYRSRTPKVTITTTMLLDNNPDGRIKRSCPKSLRRGRAGSRSRLLRSQKIRNFVFRFWHACTAICTVSAVREGGCYTHQPRTAFQQFTNTTDQLETNSTVWFSPHAYCARARGYVRTSFLRGSL